MDLDRPNSRGDGSGGQVAVADDLAAAVLIPAILMAVDPIGDLGRDGLGEEWLGPAAEDLGEDVLGLGQWHDPGIGSRKTHGGVLLCRGGTLGGP